MQKKIKSHHTQTRRERVMVNFIFLLIQHLFNKKQYINTIHVKSKINWSEIDWRCSCCLVSFNHNHLVQQQNIEISSQSIGIFIVFWLNCVAILTLFNFVCTHTIPCTWIKKRIMRVNVLLSILFVYKIYVGRKPKKGQSGLLYTSIQFLFCVYV